MATEPESANLVDLGSTFQLDEVPSNSTQVKFNFDFTFVGFFGVLLRAFVSSAWLSILSGKLFMIIAVLTEGCKFLKNRNKKEKVLIALSGTIALLGIILVLKLQFGKPEVQLHAQSFEKGEICLSPKCIRTAAEMISSMDLTADPCDDFYQYSCGGWVAENPVPDGNTVWGTFAKLEEKNLLIIRKTLENPSAVFKSEAEKKAKLYYESCMDYDDVIEKLGVQPMLDLLEEVGGWNISGPYNASSWSLQNSMNILHNEYNMGGFFSWGVGEDDKNSSRNVIIIDQGGLTLPTKDNYLDKKILEAYLDYMTETGVALGGNRSPTRQQMKDVIDFETELAEITKPDEDMRDGMKVYHLMPLKELQRLAPFNDWVEYYKDAFKKVNRTITPEEKVVVHAPEYLEKMSAVVTDRMKTDEGKITINNYLVWQTVRSLAPSLPRVFRDAFRILRRVLVGSDTEEEAWVECVTDTTNVMGFAVGAMFVRAVFSPNSKAGAEGMIGNVRGAFMGILKDSDWMDGETKFAAIRKAKMISDMIGFPEFILNPDQLDKKYNDLIIKRNEYFKNNLRINRFNSKRNLRKLDEPVEKNKWSMPPSVVNAYYAPTKNQMVFPAGILRPPFYDISHCKSLNYGAMGVVMGHELTHAFDDLGRMYDQNGNLNKWWKNETIEKFQAKANCMVKQYDNYKINGVHVNGRQTLGENIADNGGLKAAYYAYEKISLNENELVLPGLNMTHKQLFFLSFAQVWCSTSTPEAALLQVEKDSHTPSMYRVIGPLSNMKEFSEVFHCPLGSKMNPEDKCVVW